MLMDERALTAKGLAFSARVSPPTATGHLARLTDGGLLVMEKRASPVFSPGIVNCRSAAGKRDRRRWPRTPSRTPMAGWRRGADRAHLYEHLVGRLRVALADSLTGAGHLVLAADGGEFTPSGRALLQAFGAAPWPGKPTFCRRCLDWSERGHTSPGVWARPLPRAVWIWAGSRASATPAP